jgi:hypothetical protein
MNSRSSWLKTGLAAVGLVAALGTVGLTVAPAQARVFVNVGVPLIAPYPPAYVPPPVAYYPPPVAYYPPPPVAYPPLAAYPAPVVYPRLVYGAPFYGRAYFGYGPHWR